MRACIDYSAFLMLCVLLAARACGRLSVCTLACTGSGSHLAAGAARAHTHTQARTYTQPPACTFMQQEAGP
jgi:hypothetical protein